MPPDPTDAPRTSARALVREALDRLLAPEDDFFEIREAVESLRTFFTEATGFAGRNHNNSFGRRTLTGQGTAIGPDQAAACLNELLRTKRYLQGVRAGLETARKRFPDRPIEVLYAGCGPYALLLLPFATLYDPDEIRVTLLDLHAESLDAVRALCLALDIDTEANGFFGDFVQADATRYLPPAGRRFHMLVTETMNRALTREPQIAITAHLLPLLHPDALVIPQEVLVEAVLADPGNESAILAGKMNRAESIADQLVLGTVLVLNARTAREWPAAGEASENGSPLVFRAHLPAGEKRRVSLRLRTTIRLHADIELTESQCSLTLPLGLAEIDPRERPDFPVEIRFVPGSDPGYECNLPRRPAGKSKT